MKLNFTLLCILTICVIGCGPQATTVEYEGQKISESDKTPSSTKNLTFKMGEDVKLGDFIVKVNKIVDYKSSDYYATTDANKKLVAIEVEYYNPTSDKQFNSNPLDWKLFDTEGYSYEAGAMIESKSPELNAVTINPGGKIKGWVSFEIPKSSSAAKTQFQPIFLDNANIEIELN